MRVLPRAAGGPTTTVDDVQLILPPEGRSSSSCHDLRSAHSGPAWCSCKESLHRMLAGTMARTGGTYRPGVSIHEAAVMLGVSPTTVRRWVASGRLQSERHDRPQGEVVRVFLGSEQ